MNAIDSMYAVEDWWSGRAPWTRLLHGMVPLRMRYFDRVVGSAAEHVVVDVGCGGGFMAEALARRGARVIGVDPCAPALAQARHHAAAAGLDIEYRIGRGEALPLDDASADIVVCVDVLEHVDCVPAVLAEVARVLKPGGRFVFDTINRTWLARAVVVSLAEGLLRLVPRGTHDPRRFIRPDELRRGLSAVGLVAGRCDALGPTRQVLYIGCAVRTEQQAPTAPPRR